jgi:hypothetical protein
MLGDESSLGVSLRMTVVVVVVEVVAAVVVVVVEVVAAVVVGVEVKAIVEATATIAFIQLHTTNLQDDTTINFTPSK